MVLNKDMLIKKEDVREYHTLVTDPDYRKKILSYLEKFKSLIEQGNGKATVKMRYIRNILGYEEYKNRSDDNLYSKTRDVLLEFGIKVQMRHHYGCNLILTFVGNESEILKESEAVRIRNEKTAKKYGYSNWAEYIRDRPSYRVTRNTDMRFDEENKFHLMHVAKKYIASELFPGAVINHRSTGCRFNLQGGYDWEVDGIKVKNVSSHIRHSADSKGFEREFFQWGIGKNEEADIFLLTGWGSVGTLDLMKGWIIDAKEIVNGREFWDRTSFLISTNDRSIDKYCNFEVDEIRLEKVREKLATVSQIEVYPVEEYQKDQEQEDIIDIRILIREWYTDIFRTIIWTDDK